MAKEVNSDVSATVSVGEGQQLPLKVRLRDEATFDNFHGERNRPACERLQASLGASEPLSLILCGDQGVGKTHLLNAACLAHESRHGGSSLCLSLAEAAQLSPQALEGLDQFDLVALDDLDCLPAEKAWEEALLHLYNRVQDAGHRLLFAVREPPASHDWLLPDLASRLQSLPVIQLLPPRDEDRRALLQARAARRGLTLGPDVVSFILRRAPRDTASLLAILEQLDEASLQSRRRLTIPFVKSILGW